MAVTSACHGSPNPKSNKLCCFIIWAGICPNSLRPEFIPINFKALVWQTGAVPEKPSLKISHLCKSRAQNCETQAKRGIEMPVHFEASSE